MILHLILSFQYQFWCDDASATIVRVGKYSSECKTREAVSTLYKQFEKFVWPTVPQQEERINQITELAVRLHGEMNPHFDQSNLVQILQMYVLTCYATSLEMYLYSYCPEI